MGVRSYGGGIIVPTVPKGEAHAFQTDVCITVSCGFCPGFNLGGRRPGRFCQEKQQRLLMAMARDTRILPCLTSGT